MTTELPSSRPLSPTFAVLLKDPVLLLAFGFGSGLSPKAPGTAGSLVALLCMPLLTMLPGWCYWLLLLLAFWVGTAICSYANRHLGGHDHQGIVWDEFVGLWLALASVPAVWSWWLTGFLLFRCFDILKPWPIGLVDKKVAGGFGIMVDDLLAGVGAWAVMAVIMLIV